MRMYYRTGRRTGVSLGFFGMCVYAMGQMIVLAGIAMMYIVIGMCMFIALVLKFIALGINVGYKAFMRWHNKTNENPDVVVHPNGEYRREDNEWHWYPKEGEKV